jgi:hypothetical protein
MESRAAQIGRIGGLTAWSRHDAETMQGAARRAFRERFLNLVDPERVLPTAEREVRADRARRAYMLSLAAKSAAARKRPGPDRDSGRARADGSPHDRPPS